MHHVARRRLQLIAADPAVLRKARLHPQHLVRHHAVGLDGHRAGQFEHDIRFSNVPALDKGPRQGRLGRIPLRPPPLQPSQQVRLVLRTQRTVVAPMGEFTRRRRRREPRGHRPTRHLPPDHARPRRDVIVSDQAKRTHAARSVTLHAVRLNDPRNAAVIRRRGRGHHACRRLIQLERTTRRIGRRNQRGLPGQDGLERIDEKPTPRRLERIPEAVLIIDRAAEDHRPRRIQNKDFGRRPRPQSPREVALAIVDIAAAQPVFRDRRADVVGQIRRRRVDEQK